jgi:hypothetical protein
MSDRNEFQRYLEPPGQASEGASNLSKEVFIDIPPPLPPPIQKAPMGLSPMEQIELEGIAYRGFASGQIPWWLIWSGWVVFGWGYLFIVMAMVTSADLALLPLLVTSVVPFWIMWRGTQAKLASDRAKAQRQARRRQDMRE